MGSIVLFFGTIKASVAQAHVKWFVDTHAAFADGVQAFSLADMEVRIWIMLALGLIISSIVLDSRLPKIRIVDTKIRHDFIEILRVFTGMSLLLTSYEGALLAPHLKAHGAIGTCLVFFEAAISTMLFANRFTWHAAVCMLILQMGVVIQFRIVPAVEYFVMVGIAVFLLFNNLRSPELTEWLKPYSYQFQKSLTDMCPFSHSD